MDINYTIITNLNLIFDNFSQSTSPMNKAPALAAAAKVSMSPPVNKTPMRPTVLANSGIKATKRQRHICGICGKELFSKDEAEAHVKNHTVEATPVAKSKPTSTSIAPTPLLQTAKPKPKLMRCKRCQAIVEARNVKTHVCDSVKYNCRLCQCSFGAEHLLVVHLENHTQFKEKPNAMKSPVASVAKTSIGRETQHVVILNENNIKVFYTSFIYNT